VLSQCDPGLVIKFTMAPSVMPYSLSNFASASALPLSSSRWISAGGARGCEASCFLIVPIVSVVDTVRGKDRGGFADLNVMVTLSVTAIDTL
jgi:hypothetical protein